jgi:sortase A
VSRALSLVSVILVTAGAIVLLDVGITLAWKEPVSSIYGALQQLGLDDDVTALEESFPEAEGPTPAALRRDAQRLARKLASQAGQGEGIGRIRIPAIGIDYALIEGTDPASLEKGPGHYSGTVLPGGGSTVGVAGHRTTYLAPFRKIDELADGDEVIVEMPYATLVYTVDEARVVAPTQTGIVRKRKEERLVMTACHPLYSAAERYAVFADLDRVESAAR